MRAAVHEGNGLRFRADVADVLPGPGEALVRTAWAGICGSDLHRLRSQAAPNRILGHECTGIVLECVDGSFVAGEPVVLKPLVGCGRCEWCAKGWVQHCKAQRTIGKEVSGGFGELVAIPVANMHRLPSQEHMLVGTLVDLVAVAIHAIARVPIALAGKHVVVIGDGPMGAVTAVVAKLHGAEVRLVGRHPEVAKCVSEIPFENVGLYENGEDADVCFETVGREQTGTLALAVARTKPRGAIAVLGVYPQGYRMALDAYGAFKKELQILGVNSFDCAAKGDGEFEQGLQTVVDHRASFEALVTHRFPVERCGEALEAFRGKQGALKVVMGF